MKRKTLSFKIIILAAAVTLGSLSSAWAKKDKESKKDILENLRFKEGQEKANDVRALQTEMLVAKSEELAIKQAKMLIKKYRGMAIEADLQLRLAELYMRRAKSERFFEINRESEFVVELAPKKVSKASSQKMVKQAIGIYEYIANKFPRYDKIDVVLFNNAFARQTIGQERMAESRYWKVIQKHNYSFLVPDSHLAIGEMAFKQKRFKHALDHFEAIKKYPQSRVYPYGLYKTAWTQYNLRKTKVAMQELENVVEFGKMVEEKRLDSRLDLRKEALADMALFYADVYLSKNAYEYFRKHAKKDEIGGLVLKLARIYERHSKYTDKDIVLRDYIDEDSTDKMVPEIYDALVWNYEDMKERPKVVKQLREFQLLCSPQSRWMKSQEKEDPACLERLRKSSLKLAEKWLRTWNKNPGYPEFADSSEQAFIIYLDKNLPSDKVNMARFAFAELLFKRKKYRPASENYSLVGTNSNDKKLSHESLYAAVLALEKAVGAGKWSDEDEALFAKKVGEYVVAHSNGKFRVDVEFKRALIAFDKKNNGIAGPIFKRLGQEFAKTEKGQKAQDFYLDILNQNKDYTALKDYSKVLLVGSKASERATKIRGIYEQAYFLEVQSEEEKGKAKEAIANYKKFVDENPKSKLAEKAWWNAVQLHFKIYDLKGGALAAHQFFQRFPKSENVVGALLKSAQAYESMAQLDRAAKVLEKLSEVDKASMWKWLSLAADFHTLQGDNAKAEKIYLRMTKFAGEELSFHALNQLAKIEEGKKKGSAAHEEFLGQIVDSNQQPAASLAKLYFVEKIFNAGNSTEAFTESMKLLKMGSEASTYAKAKARFIQAQILEEEYERQSVKSQLDRFTVVFALKTEKLEKAQKAYQSAIRYGDPSVAVEALQRLSKLYQSYVNTLKNMPIPAGLSETDAPAFQAEMQKLVMPMEEKGVETMAEALTQAKRLGLRDGSVALVQHELNLLNMKKEEKPSLAIDTPIIAVPKIQEVGS